MVHYQPVKSEVPPLKQLLNRQFREAWQNLTLQTGQRRFLNLESPQLERPPRGEGQTERASGTLRDLCSANCRNFTEISPPLASAVVMDLELSCLQLFVCTI